MKTSSVSSSASRGVLAVPSSSLDPLLGRTIPDYIKPQASSKNDFLLNELVAVTITASGKTQVVFGVVEEIVKKRKIFKIYTASPEELSFGRVGLEHRLKSKKIGKIPDQYKENCYLLSQQTKQDINRGTIPRYIHWAS